VLQRIALAFILSLSVLLLACGGGNDGSDATEEPTATAEPGNPAEMALGQYILATFQKEYVGDCSKAEVARDAGRMCSVHQGERAGQQAFAIGNTFSEGSHWAFVENRGGQWVVTTAVPITQESLAVPGIPWPIRPDDEVVVVVVGGCGTVGGGLNVREGPGLNQAAVDCIAEGTRIRISAGPVDVDNLQWYQIQGRSGWVAGVYLRHPDALE
jgi:hypothetical protein